MLTRAAEYKNATFLYLFSVIHSVSSGHWQRLESHAGHLVLPLVRMARPLPTTAHGNWWKGGLFESGLGKFEKWKVRKNTLSLFPKNCKVEKWPGRTCYCRQQPLVPEGKDPLVLVEPNLMFHGWTQYIGWYWSEGSTKEKNATEEIWACWFLCCFGIGGGGLSVQFTCKTQKYQTI